MKIQVAYFPLARTTFSMPDAEADFNSSALLLDSIFKNLQMPAELLTSPEMLAEFADTVHHPDLIIYQCVTFIGADFVTQLTNRFHCPVIIWAVREPTIDGTRLKLNSLTGAFSAGNKFKMLGYKFNFLFGNPDEPAIIEKLKTTVKALEMVKKLKTLTIGVIGTQPAGFEFGAVDEPLLQEKFGVKIIRIGVEEIIQHAGSFQPEQIAPFLEELKSGTKGGESIPQENMEKFARLSAAYYYFINENNVQAIASRCWPDFFVNYGAPVCSVLSVLNDKGIPASCETDIGGALSMFIGAGLSGGPVYFGDPVAIDEKSDAVIYWHCGAGATCLARKDKGAVLGVHPNRKIGPTMEFGLKEGPVTVMRFGTSQNGFRMFIMKGDALDEPQKFNGTSVAVRPHGGESTGKIPNFIADGWEPHFIIAYGDIVEELRMVCSYLEIDTCEY